MQLELYLNFQILCNINLGERVVFQQYWQFSRTMRNIPGGQVSDLLKGFLKNLQLSVGTSTFELIPVQGSQKPATVQMSTIGRLISEKQKTILNSLNTFNHLECSCKTILQKT